MPDEISLLKNFKCKFDRYTYKCERSGEHLYNQEVFIESGADSSTNFDAYLHNMNVFSNLNGIFFYKTEEMEKSISVEKLLSYFSRNWNDSPQAFIYPKTPKKFAYATGLGGKDWKFDPIVPVPKQEKKEEVSVVQPTQSETETKQEQVTEEKPKKPTKKKTSKKKEEEAK